MLIEPQEGAVVISRVYPNTPAERAGIHVGDRIAEIDGISTRGWTRESLDARIAEIRRLYEETLEG